MVQSNTYGSKMSNTQAEVAVALLRKMKNCFEKFQDKVQKQQNATTQMKRDGSNVSVRSNASLRSNSSQQRFVKLKKV